MNTVRLSYVESPPAAAPAEVAAPAPRVVQPAANATRFANWPLGDGPWRASSARERVLAAVAAGGACAGCVGAVVGLFAALA